MKEPVAMGGPRAPQTPPTGGPRAPHTPPTERAGEPPHDLPTLDFATFVLGIIGTAYMHLGDAPSPEGVVERDLGLARQDIDLLGLLQDKTKGNLTGEEERLMEQALCDLRMRYIEVARG